MSFYSGIVTQLNAAVQSKDAAKVALASREAVGDPSGISQRNGSAAWSRGA